MLYDLAVAFFDLLRTAFSWFTLQLLRVLAYLLWFVHLLDLLYKTHRILKMVPF